MKHTIENLEKSRVKILIELNKDEWAAEITNAYEQTKEKYKVQGFRNGHAPRKMIETVYGEGVFFDDALNNALNKYYGIILDKNKELFPVGEPSGNIEDLSEKGLKISVTVAVKPELKIGAYKGMKIKKIEYNVKDADIKKALKTEQEKVARIVDVAGRPAKDGDIANIDFSGMKDGVKFAGGTAEKYDLTLGSKTFIPGFEEQIVGMNINEEKDVNVTFPAEYQEKSLAGQPVVFKVKLNALKEKELPKLDDEFAKDVSKFDTLNDYKEDIKKKLQEQNDIKANREMEDKILETIAKTAEGDIPDEMIETQVDNMIQELQYSLMYQGVSIDQYLAHQNKKMDELRKDMKATALKNVKAQLCIEKIIKEEKIESSKEEVDAKIKEMAEKSNKKVTEMKRDLKPEQMNYIKNNIVIEKLFDMLRKENIVEA